MKMHTNMHREAKLLPTDTFLSRKNAFAAGAQLSLLLISCSRSVRPRNRNLFNYDLEMNLQNMQSKENVHILKLCELVLEYVCLDCWTGRRWFTHLVTLTSDLLSL